MEQTLTTPANPLGRLAGALPVPTLAAISAVARIVGAGALLFYAYDQDSLFPTRHFPRTWVLAAAIAAIAAISLVSLLRGSRERPGLFVLLGALGAGVLVFGGANFAQRPAGVIALLAGFVAWVAFAALCHQERRDIGRVVSGLMLGSLLTFGLVGLCVLAVPN